MGAGHFPYCLPPTEEPLNLEENCKCESKQMVGYKYLKKCISRLCPVEWDRIPPLSYLHHFLTGNRPPAAPSNQMEATEQKRPGRFINGPLYFQPDTMFRKVTLPTYTAAFAFIIHQMVFFLLFLLIGVANKQTNFLVHRKHTWVPWRKGKPLISKRRRMCT